MNKQELIDKAIEKFGGRFPERFGTPMLHYLPDMRSDYWPYYLRTEMLGPSTDASFVCSQEQFNKRARELGWINGYKWGVEYPTNGKKPDLPDDVLVDILIDSPIEHASGWLKEAKTVGSRAWKNGVIEAFRIVDERHKPVDTTYLETPAKEPVPDLNSWYDYEQQKAIADTPPHDTECEYSYSDFIGWKRCKYIGINSHGSKRFAVIFDSDKKEYLNPKVCSELKFRPLDHATRGKELERKKFVDFVTDLLYKHCCATKGELRDGAEKLFELGFKLPENCNE